MIDPAASAIFPNNIVICLSEVFPAVDEDAFVINRPLRPTDPNYSIGVYATLWQPEEDSFEMGGKHAGPNEPTLSQYQIGVQTMIKDGDSVRGLAISSIFTKRVRMVLYRNEPMRVALGELAVTDASYTERLRRWGVRSQRFMSNDVEGQFVFISVLDLWMETEMS